MYICWATATLLHMLLSITEENYLKTLLRITTDDPKGEAGTNELAQQLQLKPATVNDMLKKLKDKKLIAYEKYGKITMSAIGKKQAINVIRKHRLWETFLYEKLEFTWDEVHEVAEQLEHIQSTKLIEKIEKFLKYPSFDPHGDPIPNAKGEFKITFKKTLDEVAIGTTCKMVAVKDNSSTFLQYVVGVGLGLNNKIKVLARQDFDAMLQIEVNGQSNNVSQKFAQNIYVV